METSLKSYQDGGEAILEAIRNLGIEYIMSSPGSEWSPVWEAMARQTDSGAAGPQFIECWHENVAVDMAIGYTAVTGRPQAVLVHAGVGLMHGAMAVLSASQGEIPMLLMSGESTSFGADPSRQTEAQWYGGVSVGGADRYIGPLVKWSRHVSHPSVIYESVTRAGEMAERQPKGPVYLNVSLEAMLHPWTRPELPRRIRPAPKLQPLSEDIAEIGVLLANAQRPLIVTETAGRDVAAFDAMIELAQRYAIPVINGRASHYTNFPKDHPMWLGYTDFGQLEDSDLILIVNGRTPWYPPWKRPGVGHIVAISEYPLKDRLAYQCLHADRYLEGDVATSLSLLAGAAASADKATVAKRRAYWAGEHDALMARLKAAGEKALAGSGIDAVALARVAAEELPDNTIVVDETITHMQLMRPHLPLNRAQSFFRVAAGALGQGMGCALGVKLAARKQPVVLFVGDGSFMYNPIVQSLGASNAYQLPILIVVCNNGGYEAMRKGHLLHYPGGVSDTKELYYGVNLDGPEYHELGSPFGCFGAKAGDLNALRRGFRDALAAVESGRSAIVNVVMTQ
ncbi:MAG: hypothetical protein A3H32_11220 [Betaproteobacteria bacterium RIFCSPLOWO2_02_FULL_63_19]|nr:MAG: hypothetical protein A3H32_11220 [Betaproteobacteria bacterium RIFCSPLOWO2_02_FULL_63_19]